MAYTPINWQTGDTITAEKLNRCDNGWEVQDTQLFSESVTTTAGEYGNMGFLSYTDAITADTLTVTFNGTEYTCSKITLEGDPAIYYGGMGENGPNFSKYPFFIESDEGNVFFTETAGTYSVAGSAVSVVVSPDFEKAVAVVEPSHDFEIIPGTTTYAEAHAAFTSKKNVYFFVDGTIQKAVVLFVGYEGGTYRVVGVTATVTADPYTAHLQASSEDGVLQ